ncbi:MarR family winged helix-turn-helix transcriptional regulator [Streptomyces sp. 35G-GA-8]|uniref:MarR family winged helix-turn-helix transcriptional regulator n=1 Tax=Streptomyces sp. 35G-GA-8 TaxID=2939434 RepID=UPI0035AEF839
MPPIQDMTSAASVSRETPSEPSDDAGLLDALQHQVAVFARRAEQTRLGGVGQVRNSMDRAAYLLLNRLDREGPMGVKALAAGMGIDSSTVTRQVAPLVDSGLVKRTSHPEDGRAVVLELSARGLARLEEVRSSRRELMAQVTGGWTEEERNSFTTLLTRFNGALSARAAGLPSGDGGTGGDGDPDVTGVTGVTGRTDEPEAGDRVAGEASRGATTPS